MFFCMFDSKFADFCLEIIFDMLGKYFQTFVELFHIFICESPFITCELFQMNASFPRMYVNEVFCRSTNPFVLDYKK